MKDNNTIVQELDLKASPEMIYDLLMDEKKHAAFTGAAAKITNRIGGKFEVWDGYITGKNIELIKGKKIVQEWYSSDMPKGHISMLTFELSSPKKNITHIKMTHEQIPDGMAESFAKGWDDFYWKPMKAYLKKLG